MMVLTKFTKLMFLVLLPLSLRAETLTTTKIAELAAHRLDRLITQGRIDSSFGTKLEKIEVSVSPSTPVQFRAEISQTQPTEGLPLRLEMLFDASGKVLSYNLLPGGTSGADLKWTQADAITLMEESLHTIMDHNHDANILPFSSALNSVSLSRSQYEGQEVALLTMLSLQTSSKLLVYLKLDGGFINAVVVP